MKSIELLNSEGPILILEKSKDLFVLKNSDKQPLGCLSKSEILDFLTGGLSIVESSGKVINYMNYPDSMKQEHGKIMGFLQR